MAVFVTGSGERHESPFFCPGESDIEKPPFFFQGGRSGHTLLGREKFFFQTGDKYIAEFQSFRCMEGHFVLIPFFISVLICQQRYSFEEGR